MPIIKFKPTPGYGLFRVIPEGDTLDRVNPTVQNSRTQSGSLHSLNILHVRESFIRPQTEQMWDLVGRGGRSRRRASRQR